MWHDFIQGINSVNLLIHNLSDLLYHHWMWRRMWKNEERKTVPGVIRIFDRRYPLGWDVWVLHPGNPSVTFSAPELSSALLVRGILPKLCIFIAPKHQPYRHHQVQKWAKICLNCIQSPSITNSQMFYMDRWSEDDFSRECIRLIEGTFPLSLINVETLFIEEVISLSVSALWGLCYRQWDVWVSRKWSGKISHHFSDAPHCVSCGELSVSQITVWSPVISSGSFSGYWMMRNLIPWWEIEARVKMNLSISSLIMDWQGTITLSACILWL